MILRYCTGKYEITVVHYDEDYAKTNEKVDLYSTDEACPFQAISALNASVVFFMLLHTVIPRLLHFVRELFFMSNKRG